MKKSDMEKGDATTTSCVKKLHEIPERICKEKIESFIYYKWVTVHSIQEI